VISILRHLKQFIPSSSTLKTVKPLLEVLILHDAVRVGDAVTVRTLLSTAGALYFINTQDASGATPLFYAAYNGHAPITEELIEAGCIVDMQQEDGAAPVHAAAQNGHAAVTKQLIKTHRCPQWSCCLDEAAG
jgi:ankyrin repeat protein